MHYKTCHLQDWFSPQKISIRQFPSESLVDQSTKCGPKSHNIRGAKVVMPRGAHRTVPDWSHEYLG